MSKVKLALLGCGDVAQRDYLPEFHRIADRAEIGAVCGRTPGRAQSVAAQYAIPQWYTDYAAMLAESDADAVINLTPIQLHAETNLAVLAAGKHLYSEKPVAATVAEVDRIAAAAARAGRIVVCAPSVMLFPQVRYAQSLLAEGAIGAVYAARGQGHMGVPPWHGYGSDPSPYFAAGGGPALDMGVYPLHTLTGLLGPVRRVTAFVSKVLDEFVVPDGPAAGKRVPVEAEDNWQMVLDFGEGRLATVTANNVVVGTRAPQVELYGLAGTIALDAIDAGAPVELLQAGRGWRAIAPPFPGERPGRAAGPDHILGVELLVDSILHDRKPLWSLEHARHVIDVIESAARAAASGRVQEVRSSFSLPAPWPAAPAASTSTISGGKA